ncbi:hypothetical protein [Limnohabitans sp.]|uniref:hypothetical protein n=1 Tax=Limnohabitans sp. TaxID=1907725 RepID=UPI00286F7A2C|nr:hypothetical protein [Limnohabitans sp.]
MTQEDTQAAAEIGIVMSGSIADRINRAVHAHNLAARLAVGAGYLLLDIRAELAHEGVRRCSRSWHGFDESAPLMLR